MTKLLQEFKEMKKLPLFEIEIEAEGFDSEFFIYHIEADEKGIYAGGCSNSGFHPYGISVAWDECFSLDEHLEALYELCYEKSLEN